MKIVAYVQQISENGKINNNIQITTTITMKIAKTTERRKNMAL